MKYSRIIVKLYVKCLNTIKYLLYKIYDSYRFNATKLFLIWNKMNLKLQKRIIVKDQVIFSKMFAERKKCSYGRLHQLKKNGYYYGSSESQCNSLWNNMTKKETL